MSKKIPTTSDEVLNEITSNVAKIYNIEDPSKSFEVPPSKVQKIERGIVEKNDFLKSITNEVVSEMSGDILRFGATDMLFKRTTQTNDNYGKRRPNQPFSLGESTYQCLPIEADIGLSWGVTDSWKHKPRVYELFREKVAEARAASRLKAGWYGQMSAKHTDSEKYQMGEDVCEGWFQYLIKNNPENVLGITPDSSDPLGYTVDEIRVGEGGDFKNLDQLIFHMRQTLINKHFRNKTDLRAIVGSELLYNERSRYFEASKSDTPSEVSAREVLLNGLTLGGVKPLESDAFPERGLFLSPLNNIHHYTHAGTVRKQIKQSHENKGLVDYYYANIAYLLAYLEGAAAVHPDAVLLKEGSDWVKASDAWKAAA